MSKQWVLGVDIGGTNIRAGLVAPDYALCDFEMSSSARLFEDGQIGRLSAFVRGFCKRRLGDELPAAVAIGFPSTVNRARTKLLSTPNLPGFDNLEIVGPLERELSVPVFIDRDVNMLMLNDIHEQALEGAETVVGCYFGTGLGNAIYWHGEIMNGKNGVAGELGHMPVLGCERVCGCGNIGCMETLASGRYLEELCDRRFPGEPIGEVFSRHGDTPALCDFVEYLSLPVASEINLLDPDTVVLGGGVLQMRDFPMSRLLEYIGRHTRKPLPFDSLDIRLSSQKQESGVIGAGMCAYRRMQKGRDRQ